MALTRSGNLIPPALIVALAVWIAIAGMNPWGLQDMAAYRGAAERLVQGQSLYPPPGPILDSSDVYRYAPWFALLWVPLVAVPESWVAAGWSLVLVAASIGAVLPLLRDRQPLPVSLAVLGFVLCLRAAAIGNVEPLMVAALVHGVERRSGPLWIALAASLKVGPLALVLVYIGRGEWARVAWTALLTAAFVAPMLLFDLSHYRTEAGASMSLLALAGPLPWIAAVCVAGAVTVLVARTRWAWPAACVTALLALPRLGFYNLPLLLVGAAGGANRRHSPSAGSASR